MAGLFRFGTDPWDPSHRFETSWVLSPWALFACRASFACYALFVQFFVLGWDCAHESAGGCWAAGNEFSYFTVLTYWGLAFYFAVAAAHTLTYARTGRPLLDRFPRPLQALHPALYATVTVYPFIVTVVFWAVLYSGTWWPDVFSGWSNVSQHALNSAGALFEVLVARTAPHPWLHMLWLVAVLALYLALAYITVATKHWYPYDFLDPSITRHGLVAAYVFGIALACVVVFSLVNGVIRLRLWLTETRLGMHGRFAAGDLSSAAAAAAAAAGASSVSETKRRRDDEDVEMARLRPDVEEGKNGEVVISSGTSR